MRRLHRVKQSPNRPASWFRADYLTKGVWDAI
jgi:hypothetical protein